MQLFRWAQVIEGAQVSTQVDHRSSTSRHSHDRRHTNDAKSRTKHEKASLSELIRYSTEICQMYS